MAKRCPWPSRPQQRPGAVTQTTRHITVTTLLKQATPLRRPAFVDTIDDVSKLFFDEDLGHDIYRVALGNCDGGSMSLCLPGDELRVFEAFYAALRSRGVRFADRGFFTGRRGQDHWETHLDELLNGGELPR